MTTKPKDSSEKFKDFRVNLNKDFEKRLETLINKCSVDALCETHDFVLAEFLVDQLDSFHNALKEKHRLTTQS